MTRRNCLAASPIPAAHQRSSIWPSRHRFTFVLWSRQISTSPVQHPDGVGRPQRRGHPEAADGERLGQSFTQRPGRAGVSLVERTGQRSRGASGRRGRGIDWATDDHSVCVVDAAGDVLDEFVVDHTEPGLRGLCRRISNEVRRVAIERPDGPVVDALMDAGLEVVVVVGEGVPERYATQEASLIVATPTSWPTASAPMVTAGPAWNPKPLPPPRCGPTSARGGIWSPRVSRSPTNYGPISRSTSPAQSACSLISMVVSPASSCVSAGSLPRMRSPG